MDKILEFYNNISLLTKNMSKFVDEEGNYKIIPTINLLLQCEYVEFESDQIDVVRFKKIIDRTDLPTKKKMVMKDKSHVTGNKKDLGTIIDSEIEVAYCWVVSNNAGLRTTFIDRDEAITNVAEQNHEIMKGIEI